MKNQDSNVLDNQFQNLVFRRTFKTPEAIVAAQVALVNMSIFIPPDF